MEVRSALTTLRSGSSCSGNVHLGLVLGQGNINISLPFSHPRGSAGLGRRRGRGRGLGLDHAMVDISVVSDDLTLNRWSADSLWRSRRRRGLGGRRRGWGLFALDNASADSLTLFNSGRGGGGGEGDFLGRSIYLTTRGGEGALFGG
jgi:hypothetical protein